MIREIVDTLQRRYGFVTAILLLALFSALAGHTKGQSPASAAPAQATAAKDAAGKPAATPDQATAAKDAAGKPAATPTPDRVPITDNVEALTVQNLSLKEHLLQKQYTEFQNAWKEFQSQRAALESERRKVEAQLLKAHALDPAQYHLDEQNTALVKNTKLPVPAPSQPAPAHH